MKKQYRHGDLMLEEVDSIPEGGKQRKSDVLLEGEATGHAHRIGGISAVYDLPNGETYLNVDSPSAQLKHEEHRTIDVPAGKYRVIRQVEYEPYKVEVRRVQD